MMYSRQLRNQHFFSKRKNRNEKKKHDYVLFKEILTNILNRKDHIFFQTILINDKAVRMSVLH